MPYRIVLFVTALIVGLVPSARVEAQTARTLTGPHRVNHGSAGPVLHVGSQWRECAIRLNASLSQAAFAQFTREAGLLVYFRSLSSARPIGKGRFEIAVAQWETGLDEHDAAWNDTFVHPDSTHYLFDGDGLQFPGLTARVGVSDRVDVGMYYTRNPNANYGFFGGQLQYALPTLPSAGVDAAVRVSAVNLFGPDDVDVAVFGAELVGSRTIAIRPWISVAPYAGASGFVATGRETSSLVNLDDVTAGGVRGLLGAEVQILRARVAVEYNVASVNSFNVKFSVGN